jgi:predicted lipid-binding transport protein (Tim44 family)
LPEIIILACVALFIGLRLYAVLGRRTGHEQQQPLAKTEPSQRSPLIARTITVPKPERKSGEVLTSALMIDPAAVDGVRAVVSADSHFDVGVFLDGARSAYRQTLEAFWAEDETTRATLVADDVLASFREAIAMRRDAGETLANRLVDIERATIDSAIVSGQTALVTVRFDADIAAVTRDRDGNVVAGSLTDAVQTHDLWTFSRNVRAGDPNWLLVETDEAA